MIKLQQLTKTYGDRIAVDHVSFTVPGGQICGYLGPNGAGKTTTVKMLTGMLPPTSGSAWISGSDVQKQTLDVKRQIGYVPESGALYQSLTPLEYLQFVGRLHHMDESELLDRIHDFAAFFKLGDHLNESMQSFSKGMKQKVVILSSVLHNPEVICLDEPLNGLDANAALLLKTLLRHLAEQGKTVFYCSHILEVVENLCDRVVIINEGRIVADGSVGDLKSMTRQASLEGVFSQLTSSEDTIALAKALSQKITSTGVPQ
ncbi:ABC transporter ATP-binding protein [bacterium]|nr:ABC transporter ATP-binding protein [bacterium]